MHDESGFLTAIDNDRENDALRLVYADWLEERGEHRCEYLRAMCELVAMPARRSPEREQLLSAVKDFHTLYGLEWPLAVARRIDVTLHTVHQPTLLRQLVTELRRITGLNEFNAIDLVRGMPNTGRFRSDPRRVIQVSRLADAEEIVGRLRQCGASATFAPATELVERVNLGLEVRHGAYAQAGRP